MPLEKRMPAGSRCPIRSTDQGLASRLANEHSTD